MVTFTDIVGFAIVVLFGPFLCGQLFGWRVWRFGSWKSHSVVVFSGLVGCYAGYEDLLSNKLQVLAAAALSYLTGYIIGRRGSHYIAIVGYSGFVFTLSAATLSVGLGQLGHGLVDYLLWLAFDIDKNFELAVVLQSHVLPVLAALMLLMHYGDFSQALDRLVFRKIVAVATLWGVLGLFADYVQGTLEANLLWWLCGRQRMGVEGIFLSYAIGTVLVLPLFKYGRAKKSDAGDTEVPTMDGQLGRIAGVQVAMERLFGRQIANQQETIFQIKEGLEFHVSLPIGWRLAGRTQKKTQVSVRFRLPGNWPATVHLNAYAFAPNEVKKELKKEFKGLDEGKLDHPIFDPRRRSELLKHTAERNLATRDAVIIEADSDILDGIPSFECYYKRPLRRGLFAPLLMVDGYVLTFIVEDYEFVFMFEADAEVLKRFLPEAKQMVRNMTFKGQKLEARNGSPDI